MPGGNPYHDDKGRFTDGPSGGDGGSKPAHVVKAEKATARGHRYLPEDKRGVELFEGDTVEVTTQSSTGPKKVKAEIDLISPAGTHANLLNKKTREYIGSYSLSDVERHSQGHASVANDAKNIRSRIEKEQAESGVMWGAHLHQQAAKLDKQATKMFKAKLTAKVAKESGKIIRARSARGLKIERD